MGFFKRLLGLPEEIRVAPSRPGPVDTNAIFGGSEPLEVVGESFYQDAIHKIAAGTNGYTRMPVIGTLFPETRNRYDANAISAWVSGLKVGHLSREDAATFRPGLLGLQQRLGVTISLPGVIVGGGEGRPYYGVFLNYSPAAFGLASSDHPSGSSGRIHVDGRTRTGLSDAVKQDADDDDYDLGWQTRLPAGRVEAMTFLRHELASERAAISRHFMHAKLEELLYDARDDSASALDEFDTECETHHAEMHVLRPALVELLGGVPVIEMYKQAAIRHQKAHDWQAALRWAEAGLQVYGTEALRREFVDDLGRRANDCRNKLKPKLTRENRTPTERTAELAVEVLTCSSCSQRFERTRVRGRKPERCPACRAVVEFDAPR
jgi:predicted Zn-ribbon and HTH transcriptional regulator